jgi:DNA-binding transcriptional ArsR family regulator
VAEASGVRPLLQSAPNAIRSVASRTLLGDHKAVRASERPASASDIEQILLGGDPRSVHGVDQVIAAALADPSALEALFECLFCADAVVRMRVGDALEKIARIQPELVAPFTRRLLSYVADVDQPSVQWHLAQILTEIELTPQQRRRATAILKRNLERYEDWIVVNLTLQALAHFARDDLELCRELAPILRSHQADTRKSVAKRATKLLAQLKQAP